MADVSRKSCEFLLSSFLFFKIFELQTNIKQTVILHNKSYYLLVSSSDKIPTVLKVLLQVRCSHDEILGKCVDAQGSSSFGCADDRNPSHVV